MRARAFTLIELGIVISIIGIIVPVAFVTWRQLEDTQVASMSRLNASRAVRTLSEELRADRRRHGLKEGGEAAGAVSFSGSDKCDAVAYVVKDSVVVREDPCGPARALARGVTRFERSGELVRVAFDVAGADVDVSFAIGLGGGR